MLVNDIDTVTNMANSTWSNLSQTTLELSDRDLHFPASISLAGIAVGIIIIAVGAFGNVIIILAVIFSKPLCKSSNIFMVSLAVCDLFQSLMVKPLYVHTYIAGRWLFGRQVCLYALFASNLAILESILHVTVIAFYRYVIICHPKCAPRLQTLRSVILVLLGLYIIPLLIVLVPSLPRVQSGEVVFNEKIMFCSFVRHSEFRLSGVLKKVLFLLAAAIFLFYCYIRIYTKVRESGRSVNEQGTFSPSRIRREMSLLKMVIVTYVTFVISYLPLSILYGADIHRTCPYIVYFIGVCLLWVSSSINWVIYGLVNKQYSAAYRYILCRTIPISSRYHDNHSWGSRSSHYSTRDYVAPGVAPPTANSRKNSHSSVRSATLSQGGRKSSLTVQSVPKRIIVPSAMTRKFSYVSAQSQR